MGPLSRRSVVIWVESDAAIGPGESRTVRKSHRNDAQIGNMQSSAGGCMQRDVELYNAVREQAIVKFDYDGRGERTVEAHGFEIRPGGRRILVGFQVAGTSLSGRPVGWRAFDVEKISDLRRTNETFDHGRRAPTTDEAGQLIDSEIARDTSNDEIVAKLERLGTPAGWIKEYLRQKGRLSHVVPLSSSTTDARPEEDDSPARCSFCDRSQEEVGILVSGPGVYICPECVKTCADIMREPD